VGTDAEVALQTVENSIPAAVTVAEVGPKANTDVADTISTLEPGATASGAPKPDQSGTGKVLAVEQIRLSPSTLETVSRCALLASAGLYGLGLVIANFNAQLYGRYSLGFVEAQYVLVGLLWLFLTLLAFALMRYAFQLIKILGPWRGRPLRQNVKQGLWVPVGLCGGWWVYASVVGVLGVSHPYWSWESLVIIGVLLLTTITLGDLFQKTWRDMKCESQPGDSFLVKLWKVNSIQIARRVLSFFTALFLYGVFVYPQLSAAAGGGRLHQAEIIIRQDRRSVFDGMTEFKIDKAGKLGPVSIVAESDQSLIVTATDKPWWETKRRSLLLKKDLIELVIYTE
jgi:hypothetical protein